MTPIETPQDKTTGEQHAGHMASCGLSEWSCDRLEDLVNDDMPVKEREEFATAVRRDMAGLAQPTTPEPNTELHRDYGLIVGSAVRYALGRRTYIVSTTVDYAIRHMDELPGLIRTVMLRDIDECSDLGAETDRLNWQRLRETLSNKEGLE